MKKIKPCFVTLLNVKHKRKTNRKEPKKYNLINFNEEENMAGLSLLTQQRVMTIDSRNVYSILSGVQRAS